MPARTVASVWPVSFSYSAQVLPFFLSQSFSSAMCCLTTAGSMRGPYFLR